MSEYQYYEFQALDQSLNEKQMDELSGYSSRAQVTPNKFSVVYNYGDFSGDPKLLMSRYFDAFIYLANWGSRRFMLRLPIGTLGKKEAQSFQAGSGLSCAFQKKFVVLSFTCEEDEHHEWEEGEGWLSSLLPIRRALLRGDRRSLYLGWLCGLQAGALDDESIEPPVPPGLAKLDTSLKQLMKFMRIDVDLLAAAAEQSPSLKAHSLCRTSIDEWIATLTETKKNAWLVQLIENEDPALSLKLQKLVLEARRATSDTGSSPPEPRRTVSDLERLATKLRDRRIEKDKNRAAHLQLKAETKTKQLRVLHLRSLEGKERLLWIQVHKIVQTGLPKRYDSAVFVLQDLRDLSILNEKQILFAKKLTLFRAQYGRRTTLIKKCRDAQIW